MIYIFFVLAWIVFVLHLSFAIRQLITGTDQAPVLRQILLIIAFTVTLTSFNTHDLRAYNLFTVYKGLARKVPQRYSAELGFRYRMLQQGGDTILVPKLTTKEGNVLYFLDITANPAHDQNRHYARYWGKKAVGLDSDTSGIVRPY